MPPPGRAFVLTKGRVPLRTQRVSVARRDSEQNPELELWFYFPGPLTCAAGNDDPACGAFFWHGRGRGVLVAPATTPPPPHWEIKPQPLPYIRERRKLRCAGGAAEWYRRCCAAPPLCAGLPLGTAAPFFPPPGAAAERVQPGYMKQFLDHRRLWTRLDCTNMG
eukprot:gene9673-biopygen5811